MCTDIVITPTRFSCHVPTKQFLSASSWRENSFLSVDFMMTRKPVINCFVFFIISHTICVATSRRKWGSNFVKVRHKKGRHGSDQKPSSSEINYMSKNVLSSVNNILTSFDDTFVLSAIYDDILSPVIEEAVIRKESSEPYFPDSIKNELPQVSSFIKKPDSFEAGNQKRKEKPKWYPENELYDNKINEKDFASEQENPESIVRDYQTSYVPFRQTRLGKRMRKGVERLASSIPKWQSALQLVGTAILVLIIPGAIVQFG